MINDIQCDPLAFREVTLNINIAAHNALEMHFIKANFCNNKSKATWAS